MASLDSEPIFTETYEQPNEWTIPSKACVLFGASPEERSAALPDAFRKAGDSVIWEVVEIDTSSAKVRTPSGERTVFLRSERELGELWKGFEGCVLYIDITGLPHHGWAPLLRSALGTFAEVKGLYVEPFEYKKSDFPVDGQIYDLSERIQGVAPIPGFASIRMSKGDEGIFVPLLGFEGTRLSYLVEQIQPQAEKIVPVIGLPGFRVEYPLETYVGNRKALEAAAMWQGIEFASAHCPFEVFYLLARLAARRPGVVSVAPIGTKPHALGAILFKLAYPDRVEIVYDHPVRKEKRTVGAGKTYLYHVSTILPAR